MLGKRLRSFAFAAVLACTLAGTATASNREEDPCRTREPTPLDLRPEWRCVGLATFDDGTGEVEEEPRPTAERTESTPQDPRDEWGVAVSPDGRLYRQVAPIAAPPVRESRPFNPDGEEVDPEGRSYGYRLKPFTFLDLIGSDNRVIRQNTTKYPWRAMAAILAPGASTSRCSGAFVGPRHVLTAGHCLYKNGKWRKNRKVAPGMNGIGNFPNNGLRNHKWYFVLADWYDDEDGNDDLALIILEDKANTASLGWLGLGVGGDEEAVWTFGYPGWNQLCAASPAAPIPLCSNFLYGDDTVAEKLPLHPTYIHEADTQGGQSGSPIYEYNGGDRMVIGVHRSAGLGPNLARKITGSTLIQLCIWISQWPSAYKDHWCIW